MKNRFVTCSELRRDLEKLSGKKISSKTVQRRLNEAGLKARKPAKKKSLLTQKIKKTRPGTLVFREILVSVSQEIEY